jgi:hypothetical protein
MLEIFSVKLDACVHKVWLQFQPSPFMLITYDNDLIESSQQNSGRIDEFRHCFRKLIIIRIACACFDLLINFLIYFLI